MFKYFLHKPVVHVLLIIILGLLAYSNTFHVPFQFDDLPNIVENPIVKNLDFYANPSKAKVYKHLTEYPMLMKRYIGSLTFALNYKLHGLDVKGYHIVNLLIHLINALLVYWLIHLLFRTPGLLPEKSIDISLAQYVPVIAFFTSLLFIAHPLQTQAVTYIVQRFTSLATMFYLLSIIMYIKARFTWEYIGKVVRETRFIGMLYYLVSIFAAALAMKTKEIAFTLPVLIVFSELIFFKGNVKKRLLILVPIFLTMLIIPLTLMGIDKPLGDLIGDVSEVTRVQTGMSRLDYLFTESRVIMTYLRLIFFPINQNLDYSYPIYHSIFNPDVFLSFVFILLLFGIALFMFHRYRNTLPTTRLIFFGVIWFFVALSVESSFIPIVDVIFEHRMYLPSIGIFMLLPTSLFTLRAKALQNGSKEEVKLFAVFTLIVFILLGATYARNNIWKDEITLWEDVIRKNPNTERAYRNLGIAYRHRGMFDKAIGLDKKALEIDPGNAEAHNNLGFAYYSKGLLDEAIEQYKEALKLLPNGYKIHNNIAIAYEKTGNIDKAIEHYSFAVTLNPDFALGHYNLGHLLLSKNLFIKAIEHFQAAIKIDPNYVEAHNDLANIYAFKGDLDEAIRHLEITIKLNPNLPDVYFNLGLTYQKKGLLNKAIESFQNVVRLKPDAEAFNKLGEIYISQEMFSKAENNIASAIKLKPDWATPHYNLGLIHLKNGNTTIARNELETALTINPQYEKARDLLKLMKQK